MRVLSILCYLFAIGMFISNMMDAFIIWKMLFGMTGAVLSIVLFPIAVLLFPVGMCILEHSFSAMAVGFFWVLLMVGFACAGDYLRRKAGIFGRKIDPNERRRVLELLGRWSRAVARIDKATDTLRLTMVEQPMGMQSEGYEKARLAALTVVGQVQKETTEPRFWPILEDNRAGKIMLDLQMKLDESYAYQLNLLNLYGYAADAFRSGKDAQSPSAKEMTAANKSFARVLDQMGAIAGKLARHYQISAQEYQSELQA